MSILETLKKLHKKMTGQETTSKTIGEVLDSMQENYSGGSSGGGSSLPAVTADDNGSVLSVVNGNWDKADAPKEMFVAHLMTTSATTGTLDVDYTAIRNALYQEKVMGIKVGDMIFYGQRDSGSRIYAIGVFNPTHSEGGSTIVMMEMEMGETERDVNFAITPFNKETPYIVHMTVDFSGGTASITDGKTIADIIAVVATNLFVYAEFAIGTGYGRLQLCSWDDNTAQGEKTVLFGGVSIGAKGICIYGENNGTSDTFTVISES